MSHRSTPPNQQGADATYVTIDAFCQRTGYTGKAVRRKIEDGKWPEGVLYVRAPDGRIFINVEAFNQWVASRYRAV